MQNLERRISALESATTPAEKVTIIRRIIPGDEEIQGLRSDDGRQWTRQAGETEQDLIKRASSEARDTDGQSIRLVSTHGNNP